LTGQGLEKPGTGFIAAILYSGRQLSDVLGSKAPCGRTGTSTSVLEAGQCRARWRSGGACGEAEVVVSEDRGGEQGHGFDDSPWAAG
jgi:hypothetical protein